MKPLFTIHAGEYLVGSYIEKEFARRVNVWVPSTDMGIDLLLSNHDSTRTASIQVKFSKDFLSTTMSPIFRRKDSLLKSCGWWTIKREKLAESPAQFWIFVLLGFGTGQDFVIIRPQDLLQRLDRIFVKKPNTVQSYLWVTKQKKCWEVRGLKKDDQLRISKGDYEEDKRNLVDYLNNWKPILQELGNNGFRSF
jgi:hypothetical protein